MESQPDLIKLQRQSFSHMDQDGLTEIMLGLMMIALGFAFPSFQSVIMAIIFALVCLLCIKLLEKVRERFTYPRTGYAKLPAEDYKSSRWTVLIFSLCVSSVYILLFYFTGDRNVASQSIKWSPFFIGGQAAAAGLVANKFTRVPKMFFYAAVGIALGVYLSIVKTPETVLHGCASWALWYGVFMLIAGVVVLIRFIFKYKPQPGDEWNGQ